MALQKLTGANFDKTFVGDQVKDHQAAIQELKGAEASLKNDDVKDLVKTALDKMQSHLDEGKKLQASLRSAQARTPPAK
jgi:predicted outer membrane protein